MADKTIGSLPQATELDEESLLVTEQLGEARSVTGALLADYAKAAAQQEAQKAGEYAQSAGESATAAAQKAQEAQNVATKPPYIQGENWWVWDEESGAYVDSGVDASVSLAIADTVTGAPGSDAMVENIGTASDLLLRFTIPRGEKGEVGSVNSVNEKTGDVTLQAQDIPTAAPQDVSAWTDTQAYLDGLHAQSKALEDSKAQPGGIATLNSSGKLAQMPTAADVGAVPTSRTVNGHALTEDVTLTSEDIFERYIVVPDGTDFNTLLQPGIYAQPANANTPNNTNMPENVAFTMIVMKAGGNLKQIWQIFYTFDPVKCYIRTIDLWQDPGRYGPWLSMHVSGQSVSASGITNNGALYQNGMMYIKRNGDVDHYGFISTPEEGTGENGLAFNAKTDDTWGDGLYFVVQTATNQTVFYPGISNRIPLGLQTKVWKTGYFGSTISQSDLKLKDNIVPIDNAKAFIMALNPIAYKMTDGDTGRIHMGFGAQEVAQAAKDTDMGDLSLYQAVEVDENGHEQYYTPEAKEENLSWGLNYNELIAPLVAVVQQQEQRIQALENKIKQLTEVSA